MRLVWIVLVTVCGLTAERAFAQPDVQPKDGKVILPLSLQPTATAKPLSNAYLLPEYRDSIPGNRVQMFLRCFMEQDRFFGREESDKRQKWNQLPLTDPELKGLKDYGGRLIERDLYDAARMQHVDWQLWYFLRRDGIGTLLPDLQKMRALAEVLKTRVRGEIAAGDHAAAIHTLTTLFGLARTMEPHPTLIGHLVGVAIATIACNALDELVQVGGCPNLYWSLTDFPAPFLDLRLGVQGERVLTSVYFDKLLNATGPISEDEMTRLLRDLSALTQVAAGMEGPQAKAPNANERYLQWAADAKRVELARNRLLESGFKPGRVRDLGQEFGLRGARPLATKSATEIVKSMTPLQAIITDDVRQYEIHRDELCKWMTLPFPQASAGIKESEANVAKMKEDLVLTPTLIALVSRVKNAQARLEQRIAYARIIEAIRLYAFQNDGILPATLDDIKLPLPNDPFTGKPFEYSVKDGVATLHGANPQPGNERTNRYYEIHLAK